MSLSYLEASFGSVDMCVKIGVLVEARKSERVFVFVLRENNGGDVVKHRQYGVDRRIMGRGRFKWGSGWEARQKKGFKERWTTPVIFEEAV